MFKSSLWNDTECYASACKNDLPVPTKAFTIISKKFFEAARVTVIAEDTFTFPDQSLLACVLILLIQLWKFVWNNSWFSGQHFRMNVKKIIEA